MSDETSGDPAEEGYTGQPCVQCGRIRVFLRRDGQFQCEKCDTINPATTPKASMTDETKIEPALSAEEWALRLRGEWSNEAGDANDGDGIAIITKFGLAVTYDEGQPRYILPEQVSPLIALANAALPADDPRKITRENVALLQHAAVQYVELVRLAKSQAEKDAVWSTMRRLAALCRAFESYLPPEG